MWVLLMLTLYAVDNVELKIVAVTPDKENCSKTEKALRAMSPSFGAFQADRVYECHFVSSKPAAHY